MHNKNSILSVGILLGCFFFTVPLTANASQTIPDSILKPIAMHACLSRVSPYVKHTQANELCSCAWHEVTATQGEERHVLQQVLWHTKNHSLKKLEQDQIQGCVRQYHVSAALTKAEEQHKKLYIWMHPASKRLKHTGEKHAQY